MTKTSLPHLKSIPMSQRRPTTLERAFEVARSGEVTTLQQLRGHLSREGFSDSRAQIDGPSLNRQLAGLMRNAANP